jgi:hypothetical protein
MVIATGSALAQTPVAIQPPNLAAGVAGTLAGSASVSPSGHARYSIALTLPPGTAGVTPSLSLEYASQSGPTWMGHGWRIDGLSEVTRCPMTIVQDEFKRGISLTVEDQFCLDGQRLLRVSGTHGAAAEYRLQLDSFSKIVSFGSDTAKGPDSWEIRTKRGQIFTYGATTDATIEAQGVGKPVLAWALSRVKDQRGNYYDIQYVKTNDNRLGEYYPDRIRYTGNLSGSMVPYNTVSFVYEDRPDPWLGFVAGSRMTKSKRLTSIRTNVMTASDGSGGTLAREFRIAYLQNTRNGRSLVDHISDCNGTGACLPATSFTWTSRDLAANTFNASGSGNWGGPQALLTTNYAVNGDTSQQVKTQVTMGDFNGDGRADLARSDGSGAWTVCLSTGTNFSCQNWAGPAVITRDALTGDFNGDGLTDVAVYPKVDGPGNWTVCLSTGNGFNCSTWPGYGATNFYMPGMVNGALVGDFDGDGRDDIALSGYSSGSELLCKSIGTGFVGGTCQSYPGSNNFMYYPQHFTEEPFFQAFARNQMNGDIDGDGRTDVIHFVGRRSDPSVYPPGSWSAIRATDTRFVPFGIASTGQVMLDVESSPGETRFVDVTGDSYAPLGDIVTGFISDNVTSLPKAEFCRSDGTKLLACLTLPNVLASNSQISHVGDIDGDGRPDFIGNGGVCQSPLLALGPNNADQYGFSCEPWVNGTVTPNPVQTYYGDFNGDGRVDRATYSKTTMSTGYWAVQLAGHGGYQDLLSTVTNGVGQQTQFSYKGLYDPSVYLPGVLPTYPKANSKVVSPVVASMVVSNGVGAGLTTEYSYQASRSDLRGRGSLGFEVTKAIDKVKNITTTVTSSQDFPYIGMPMEQRSTQLNGVVLNLRTNTYDAFPTSGGAVFPYQKTSQTDKKDLDGSPISTTLASVNLGGIDAFGNVTDTTETVTSASGDESFSTHTVNTYLNQTTPWLLGLLSSSSTTKTAIQPSVYANSSPNLTLSGCVASVASSTPATLSCTLGNTGQAMTSSIAYTAGAGTTVVGPAACTASTTNCGTVTVTTNAASGTYAGTLRATPNPLGSSASYAYSLTVNPLGTTLTRSPTSLNWGTVTGTGVTKLVTVQNTGGASTTLTFAIAYTSGSFQMGNYSTALPQTTCTNGQTLGIGASCVVAVNFNPACTLHGQRNGTLTLSGTGAPSVAVSLAAYSNKTTLCN